MNRIRQIIHFLTYDIWRINQAEKNLYNFFIKQVKIIVLAFRGYTEDRINQKASALTYYTVFAVVPIAALFLAVASGFGFRGFLETQLLSHFEAQKEITEYILTFSDAYLAKSKGGMVVGVGLLVLFWSVLNVLSQIEESFNDIWQIKKSRAWVRRFTDYFSLLFILPIMALVAWGSTVFVTSKLEVFAQAIGVELYVAPVVLLLAKVAPFVLYTLIFTLIFLVIPNTKVRFISAFWAGLITGSSIQLLQILYLNGQFWMSNYNAVYGSFAAVPLFLLWLYISWVLVLVGAEVAYANQNVLRFDFDREVRHISISYRKRMSLFFMHEIIKRFENGEVAFTTYDFVSNYDFPPRLVTLVTQDLLRIGLISEVLVADNDEDAFAPAIDIKLITVSYVLKKLEAYGEADFLSFDNAVLSRINNLYETIDGVNSKSGTLLKDILTAD